MILSVEKIKISILLPILSLSPVLCKMLEKQYLARVSLKNPDLKNKNYWVIRSHSTNLGSNGGRTLQLHLALMDTRIRKALLGPQLYRTFISPVKE
jgi:hypothetical protein